MASAPYIALKIIESTAVAAPPGATPVCASLPFTYFDVVWLLLPPVEQLFFYRYPHSTDRFLSSVVPSLKSSLSLALKTYYPLAGNYRQTPGTDDQFEHYYVEGDAVSFTVAECNGQFEDLASDCERDVSVLNCLAPQLPKSKEAQPLFAVQVTIFPGQGIVIGTSVHHTACDGASSMQFTRTWAEICLSGTSESSWVPNFDRTLISDPTNSYSFFYKRIQERLKSVSEGSATTNNPSELVLASFTFTQEQIQGLKRLVSAKAEEKNISFHCSTIVATLSYAWTCFVRVKRFESIETVCIGLMADFRTRMHPPLPVEYFGNCVRPFKAKANVADLIQVDGFIVAAEAVGKAIDQLTESSNMQKDLSDDQASLKRAPILRVAGSPKFMVYDVDFGLGKPTKVEIVSAAKRDVMSVADSRGEQGGVEIGIALQKDEMDCFKKYFFEGLKLLLN